jgi:hypothetical protein
MLTAKYQEAWQKFHNKMNQLRTKRLDILKRIITKSDQQQLDSLRDNIKKYD